MILTTLQYTLYADRNALNADEDDEPMQQVLYGRLRYIVEFKFPSFPQAGDAFLSSNVHRLACIQPCELPMPGDATQRIVEHTNMTGTPVFVHIGVLECSVGRVRTEDGWSIIDRSSEWARTVFTPDNVEDVENN